MKTFVYLFSLILIISFVSCNKDNESQEDKNYTDFYDTLIFQHGEEFARDTFRVDLNKDGEIDFYLSLYNIFLSLGYSESYYEITPLHGYQICYTEDITTSWNLSSPIDTIYTVDTFFIPKTFDSGDSISLSGNYTNDSLMIEYVSSPTGPGVEYSSGISYGIERDYDNYHYIALKYMDEGNSILGWLKISFYQYGGIILNSCYYSENVNLLILE